MNIFSRAFNGLNLTPGERAFLKAIEGVVLAAVITSAVVIAPLLSAQSINVSLVVKTAVATFVMALLSAVVKYLKAQGDDPLPAPVASDAALVAQQAITAVAQKTGVAEPVIPFSPPTPAA